MAEKAGTANQDYYQSRLLECQSDITKLSKLADELKILDDEWVGGFRLKVVDVMRRARTELPNPDGRPLYAYHLHQDQFDHWQRTIAASVVAGKWPHAGAFVLWAAEWFRRSYRGDGLRWESLGNPIGLNLSQANWRNIADRGLKYWGLRAVNVNGSRYRLVAIARQAGFPIAALAEGQQGWAYEYLSGLVGRLLGAANIREDTAEIIASDLQSLVPETWRNAEMQAVCAQLALVIVALRREAEEGGAGPVALVSTWLTLNRPDWHNDLPLKMEGQAAALVDALLLAKAVPGGGGSVRARRFLEKNGDSWEEKLALDLDGSLALTSTQQNIVHQTGDIARLRMFAAAKLAQSVSGELGIARSPENQQQSWPMQSTHPIKVHDYNFDAEVKVELRADGRRVGEPFQLHGGEPVRNGMRIYELKEEVSRENERLWLKGWSSGSFRAETLIVELPSGWVQGTAGSSDDSGHVIWHKDEHRTFWKISSSFIAENPQGDRFLVRPGQDVRQRDHIHLVGQTTKGVFHEDGFPLFNGLPNLHLSENGHARSIGQEQLGWRLPRDRVWNDMGANAPFGNLEFGWRDGTTGHLRAKASALILPDQFDLQTLRSGDWLTVKIAGWSGTADLQNAIKQDAFTWRINIAQPVRDRLGLRLMNSSGVDFTLQIPLSEISWIAEWDGALVRPNDTLSLSTLNRYVARGNGFRLMANIKRSSSLPSSRIGRIWHIDDMMGLSSVRDDLARLMRPLGIDTQVELNFLDGHENHWFVQEFETEIENRDYRGWFPKSYWVEDHVSVRGRPMADATNEVEFGTYTLQDSIVGNALPIPKLEGPWLVYLAAGDRILSRPKVIGSEVRNLQAHSRLGQAMTVYDFEDINPALEQFIDSIMSDPAGSEAVKDIQSVLALASSLKGLPPATFAIFGILDSRPDFAPHLLMHAGLQEMSHVLALADGLLFDWAVVPRQSWATARDALGKYYFLILPENTEQSFQQRAEMVVSYVNLQIEAIVDCKPWLAPVFGQTNQIDDYDEICRRMIGRSGDRIDPDRQNPFRPEFADSLPNIRFSEGITCVCDAPFIAALASCDKAQLNQTHIMTIKDVRECHPNFFREAYAYAVGATN